MSSGEQGRLNSLWEAQLDVGPVLVQSTRRRDLRQTKSRSSGISSSKDSSPMRSLKLKRRRSSKIPRCSSASWPTRRRNRNVVERQSFCLKIGVSNHRLWRWVLRRRFWSKPSDRDRRGGVCIGPVAELAPGVRAPALNGSAREQRTGVAAAASRDCGHP